MRNLEYFLTPPLKARRITPGDLDDLTTLYQTPLVFKTLGGEYSRKEVILLLEKHLNHWDVHNFGYYVFEDNQVGTFLGRGGLQYCKINGKNEVEVGYAFMPEVWNKGYATQIVKELLKIGFEELKLESIVGFTLVENEASKRVLKKNGFILEKPIIYKGFPHDLYRITFCQWKKAQENL